MELPPDPVIDIRVLSGDGIRGRAGELGAVLADCVAGGASVGFMLPFSAEDAKPFWHQVAAEVDAGNRVCLGALADGVVVGTVQIVFAAMPNQPHRADVSKLLVHRAMRGRGLGKALMERVEVEAALHGRSLLVLDTALSSGAERLYLRLGWHGAGIIPGYALWPAGGECDTVLFWKRV